jgi:hypothetical protein
MVSRYFPKAIIRNIRTIRRSPGVWNGVFERGRHEHPRSPEPNPESEPTIAP